MLRKQPVSLRLISYLQMAVTVLLVIGILVGIVKCSRDFSRLVGQTPHGSSTATMNGGTTIVPKQPNY